MTATTCYTSKLSRDSKLSDIRAQWWGVKATPCMAKT